jgi:hypothetical protein
MRRDGDRFGATCSATTPYRVLPSSTNEVVTWIRVRAVDATGNVSAESGPHMVTLLALPGGSEPGETPEQSRRP